MAKGTYFSTEKEAIEIVRREDVERGWNLDRIWPREPKREKV